MKNKWSQNWGLKLGSFLFAAALWLIVTNINDPVTTLLIHNVPVELQNEQLITGSGQVYEYLDDTDVIDVVTIRAKGSIINSLGESNVIAVADVNDLTSLNTIPIRLSTNKYNDNLESITGNIESVKLSIENKISKTLPIRTNTIGTVKDGYIIGESTLEQNLIEISGPESVISQVRRAAATVNVSGFTNNIGTDSEIRLYDENDKMITAGNITKSISKVRVTVEILEMKTVPIKWNVMGTPARGYQATGEITATRNNVVIAGRSKLIANIESVEIPESALDITDAEESLEKIIDLKEYLPDGVILAEEDFQGRVRVNVVVEPVAERTVTMLVNRIQITNVPEGFEAELAEEEATYQLTLTGLAQNLDALEVNTIQVTADIAAFMESEGMEVMEEGEYLIPLTYQIDGNVSVKAAVQVHVNITEI
ncbi:MAG: CdaR family protein [Muribaculaceae bacterium]|nr:CdaR family protein [Muribaculaceae bacterium]